MSRPGRRTKKKPGLFDLKITEPADFAGKHVVLAGEFTEVPFAQFVALLTSLGAKVEPSELDECDAREGLFDDLQAEGSTFLAHGPEAWPADARLVFTDHSANERLDVGTVDEYLTRGARRAFVWYWPRAEDHEPQALLDRLAAASWPRDTPGPALVAGLQARGLDAREAAALERWLGADATLLLPR